jgi:hypothetical protein
VVGAAVVGAVVVGLVSGGFVVRVGSAGVVVAGASVVRVGSAGLVVGSGSVVVRVGSAAVVVGLSVVRAGSAVSRLTVRSNDGSADGSAVPPPPLSQAASPASAAATASAATIGRACANSLILSPFELGALTARGRAGSAHRAWVALAESVGDRRGRDITPGG